MPVGVYARVDDGEGGALQVASKLVYPGLVPVGVGSIKIPQEYMIPILLSLSQ